MQLNLDDDIVNDNIIADIYYYLIIGISISYYHFKLYPYRNIKLKSKDIVKFYISLGIFASYNYNIVN